MNSQKEKNFRHIRTNKKIIKAIYSSRILPNNSNNPIELTKPTLKQNIDDSMNYRFSSNRKYFTISIYALFVITLSALFIFIINNLDIIGAAFSKFFGALSAFIIAFFIAYFLNPIVKLVNKYIMKKLFKIKSNKICAILSLLISYIVLITALILTLTYILPQVFTSLSDFTIKLTNNLPDLYNQIFVWIEKINKKFPNLDFSFIEDEIKKSMPTILNFCTDYITVAVENIINFSISVVTTTISILLSIVISCYMILDRHIMVKNASRLTYAIFNKNTATTICQTVKECNSIFYKFIIGKALDSLIIGIITIVAMSLLRLDYPLLIGLIVGVTNMIPYFGPFIGAVPGILILLVVDPIKALIFAILILAIQQFDGLYLGPKILGESVGLSPFWIIFAITLSGAYFGVLGMFLGVPFIAVIAYLLNKFINARLKKRNITEQDFIKN